MVSTRLRAFYNPLIGFLPQLGLAAILLVGGRQAINGTITVGEFVAFYGYVLLLTAPVRMLGMALGMAQRAVASGARVFEVLDREPADDRAARRAGAARRRRPRRAARRRRSRYETTAPSRCCAASTSTSPAGRTVALVGPTGLGQDDARHRCIPRLYDPTAGSVLIDGADVRDGRPGLAARRDRARLRRPVPVLGDACARTSPTRARTRATSEIEDAARQAGIHEFIAGLPDGYETLVGERGLTLSRAASASASRSPARCCSDPRILILDDATSSVDATHRGRDQERAARADARRTTFIIGHRLSTIALADEIVVLEDGRVAARGTHDELLERSDALPRDRREGHARPGVPDAQAGRARGGGAVSGARMRRSWQVAARRARAHAQAARRRWRCCGPTAAA